MIFGTVCSGIGAPEAAWARLGWRCAFMSEIDAFPRAVLTHHYPAVPLHGDFTTIQAGDYEPIDLLCGGTPCQSFSIAGLRGGMADERGNLALEFLRLADRLRPRWVVWENVPGVLSSNEGRDFGAFIGGLAECGYGFAWRVLDAQYFGLAQRRKRVFVVGYLGDWRPAAAVLFEPAGLRGNPAPRREAGERTARPIAAGSPGGSGYRNDADTADNLISGTLTARSGNGSRQAGEERGKLIAFGGNNTAGPIDVATALNASHTASGRQDFETETFIAEVAGTLRAHHGNPQGQDAWTGNMIAHTLRGEGFDASEDGTGRGTPLVPVAFDTTQITSAGNYSNRRPGDPCHPLAAGAHPPAIAFNSREDLCCTGAVAGALGASSPQAQAVAFSAKDHGADAGALAPTLRAMAMPAAPLTAVRRLTPRECERLQGFPDDYTLVPYRNGMAADGPRYKALGNSMAVPVVAWIGRRIGKIDAQMRAHKEQSAWTA